MSAAISHVLLALKRCVCGCVSMFIFLMLLSYSFAFIVYVFFEPWLNFVCAYPSYLPQVYFHNYHFLNSKVPKTNLNKKPKRYFLSCAIFIFYIGLVSRIFPNLLLYFNGWEFIKANRVSLLGWYINKREERNFIT